MKSGDKLKTAEDFFNRSNNWDKELRELRQMCLNTEMKEEIKWGAPCYTVYGKNIVGLAGFKSYVGLWFHQGVFLKDEYNLLEQSSDTTRGLRKMMFQSGDEIKKNKNHIRSYIQEAIRNQKEGKEIKISRYKKLVIPPELKKVLDDNQLLKEAFDHLSLGKQREFAEYIATAKQAATKDRRIRKISPLIIKGMGLHDKYK